MILIGLHTDWRRGELSIKLKHLLRVLPEVLQTLLRKCGEGDRSCPLRHRASTTVFQCRGNGACLQSAVVCCVE